MCGRDRAYINGKALRARIVLELLGKKSKTLLGVDISSTAVKLVELRQRRGGYCVENYIIRALPSNAVVDRNIRDIDGVGDVIRQAVAILKPSTKEAAAAVGGSAVITRVIDMHAALDDAEMESQIIVEADQYIPYPLSDVAIDFERQEPAHDSSESVDVLLTACRKEHVESRVAALECGGLHAIVVDVEACAMERAFSLVATDLSESAARPVALFDIGATVTTLQIILDSRTVYAREQLFGGRQLLDDVQRRFGLSLAEAEAAIRSSSLPYEYQHEVLPSFQEAVVQQISRSLQFFFSSSQHNSVDHVVLAGGAAATAELSELVREHLGVPVRTANPFTDMMIGPKINTAMLLKDAPSLMIACGLAMRSRYR